MNEEINFEEKSVEAGSQIKESEIFEPDELEESREELEKKRKRRVKRDFYIELVLFFILGVLVGIAAKSEAAKRITIGFDDYKMKIGRQDYKINQLQASVDAKKAAAADGSQDGAGGEDGGGTPAQDPGGQGVQGGN